MVDYTTFTIQMGANVIQGVSAENRLLATELLAHITGASMLTKEVMVTYLNL